MIMQYFKYHLEYISKYLLFPIYFFIIFFIFSMISQGLWWLGINIENTATMILIIVISRGLPFIKSDKNYLLINKWSIGSILIVISFWIFSGIILSLILYCLSSIFGNTFIFILIIPTLIIYAFKK